jgi:hypothetical protein
MERILMMNRRSKPSTTKGCRCSPSSKRWRDDIHRKLLSPAMWTKPKTKTKEYGAPDHLRWIDRIPTAIEYTSSSSVDSWNNQADETKSLRYFMEDAWNDEGGNASWDTGENSGDEDINHAFSEDFGEAIPDKYSVVMDDDASSSSSLESWNDSTFVSDTQFGIEIQQERERLKQLYEQHGTDTASTTNSFFPFANCFDSVETQTRNECDSEKLAHFRQITSDSFLQLE